MKWAGIWNESDRPTFQGYASRTMRWVEVSLQATPASVDAASNILIEEGCGGTVIGPTPPSADTDSTAVTGYLPVDDRLEGRLEAIRARISDLAKYGLSVVSDEITVKWVQDEEWATAWKKHFKPFRVGRIVIKPTWEDYAALPGDIIVEIDPGMAFGTGYHPTTQLCLMALQDSLKSGEIVLDVGTGSGVLAIAAARLGAKSVVGLDIDSVAVETAQANVEQAGLRDVIDVERADSPLAFDGEADMITANILAAVLIDMADALKLRLRPGGKLIGSGIIVERAEDVKSAFEAIGLKTVEERHDGDWVLLVSERVE